MGLESCWNSVCVCVSVVVVNRRVSRIWSLDFKVKRLLNVLNTVDHITK